MNIIEGLLDIGYTRYQIPINALMAVLSSCLRDILTLLWHTRFAGHTYRLAVSLFCNLRALVYMARYPNRLQPRANTKVHVGNLAAVKIHDHIHMHFQVSSGQEQILKQGNAPECFFRNRFADAAYGTSPLLMVPRL